MLIKVYSFDRAVNVDVEVEHISIAQYASIKKEFFSRLKTEQAYLAIAHTYLFAVNLCPQANPSDLGMTPEIRTRYSRYGQEDRRGDTGQDSRKNKKRRFVRR